MFRWLWEKGTAFQLLGFAVFFFLFPSFVVTAGLGGLVCMWLAPLLVATTIYPVGDVWWGQLLLLQVNVTAGSVIFAVVLLLAARMLYRRHPIAFPLSPIGGLLALPLGFLVVLIGVKKAMGLATVNETESKHNNCDGL